jgi:serine protease
MVDDIRRATGSIDGRRSLPEAGPGSVLARLERLRDVTGVDVAIEKHARGVADAARTGWRVVRGWPGWRSTRVRVLVLVAVGVLVAGAVPVVLVVNGDTGSALIELPRPVAGGPTAAASTPTDRPTSVNEPPGNPPVAGGSHHSASSVVVSLRDPADTTPVTSRGATVVRELVGTGFIQVRVAGDPAALVAELREDPAVAEVDLDYGRHTTAVPNDPLYGQYQSNYLNLVRMPAAWDLLTDASSQVVAVVDTGVYAGHPDLAGRLTAGYNAVAPGSPPSDVDGHGTFVAGVIAANANNGLGTAGVAWNGRVMPVKVFDGEFAYDSAIADGIVWAVDHGARVVNLSLGGPIQSPLLQAAVRYATDRDVVVVAASGNEGDGTAQYPAAYPEVLAVGATDAAGKLVDFSSYGDWLDLAAPGFDVASTVPNGYAVGDGTSFASPMVAGVAALVRAQNPALTQAQVGDRLRAAARDAGPRGFDPYFGFGVLDAARALGAPFTADLPFPALGPGEPNDVPERAVRIDPTFNPGASGTFAVEGDVDWFRYDSASAQTITLEVGGLGFNPSLGQNADIVIDVFTGTGHAVADNQGPGLNEVWSGQVESGPVYIRVSNANGSADSRQYSVTLSGQAGITGLTVEQRLFDTGPLAVGIGDLTGDGLVDVAVATKLMFAASPHDNKVFVLAQLAGGGLGDPIWLNPVQPTITSLTLADVDRDGALDIVVGGAGGVEWFRQTAGGLTSQGLLAAASGECPFVTAADVNGDGATDLVALLISGGTRRIDVLTHGAGSAFTASTIPDVNTNDSRADIGVGDVDGDGRGDVVHTVNGTVQVHRATRPAAGLTPSTTEWDRRRPRPI